jgi:glucose/arabinose dehydrogenase
VALDRPDLTAVTVATEVTVDGLDSPLWVGPFPGGTGRLAVAEQGGRIRVVQDGKLLADPYLDIRDRVQAGGERGLLGVAFPPGFGVERETLYVHYSALDGDTAIASIDAPAGSTTLDPSTLRVLLTEPDPYPNHNGGWIGFDPDGMLLIALGDGGSGGDPENRASRLDTILGKMLRIDVLGASGEPYVIPPDNPFVGRADARPEILHYGLRNPFRDSIDPATGALWIGDVGQDRWEEVDVAPAGARGLDFGWRRWEGRHCYLPPTGCDKAGVTMPITEYPHEAGCAVIGGVVYHGAAIPALRGAYLFSDNCSGTLWAIDAGLDAPQAPVTLAETGRAISSIGVDDAGEVYLTDLAGALLRLVPSS